MFQEFPYTDMHQLNLDWIIKIAKDFLDQYTHIQDLIANGEQSLSDLTEDGLTQLQDKADNLENLLQEWYNTHSQDIADQLASALSDLNTWYTTHQNYLDQTLTDNISAFNTAADAKGAEVIASIPADYSDLADQVSQKENMNVPCFLDLSETSLVDYLIVDDNLHTMTLKAGLYLWTGAASPAVVQVAADYVLSLNASSKVFLYNNSGTMELYQCTNGAFATIDLSIRNKIICQVAETNGVKRVGWAPVYKIEKLERDIDQTKEAVTVYQAIFGLANSSVTATTGLANTRRWFLSRPVPAYSIINSINYAHDGRNSGDIYIEFWHNTGTNYEKVYTQQLRTADIDTAGVYSMKIEKQFPYNVYIAFSGNGTVSIDVYQDDGIGMLWNCNTNSPASDTIPVSDVYTFPNFAAKITISAFVPQANNILYVGPWERFKEIQAAIEYITDDTAENPYVIYVQPQGKPYNRFSMIRGLNDNPVYTARLRHISIIGMDKEHCIIRNDEGNYDKPCAEILTSGIIKNLTFIMTHDNQDPNAEKGGYCIHSDCATVGNIGYDTVIEDCNFIDYTAPCLGIGLRKDGHVTIRRCEMITDLPSDYEPHEGYRNIFNYGVLYCHNAADDNITGQMITIEDCIGKCQYGTKSLFLNKTGSWIVAPGDVTYKLIRNVFWNVSRNAPMYEIATEFTPDPMNYGNNIP